MNIPDLRPVESVANLRDRVDRLFREVVHRTAKHGQLGLNLAPVDCHEFKTKSTGSLSEFLDFITDALPDGDVYLFGGVLRDLALTGRKGFSSDVDLVVEGDWGHLVHYIRRFDAKLNKFGGYRLKVGGWPVDIWHAESTWAITRGFIAYRGISSLTDTTVLNWDAILMNWRTKTFVFREGYFEDIAFRRLDIVLEKNPNPLGMVVRVFRHLYLKDARQITLRAVRYLASQSKIYGYDQIKSEEIRSYHSSIIEYQLYRFFRKIDVSDHECIKRQYGIVSSIVEQELRFG